MAAAAGEGATGVRAAANLDGKAGSSTLDAPEHDPELAELLSQASTLLALTGGNVQQASCLQARSFDGKRTVLLERIETLERLIEMRDSKSSTRMEQIRARTRVYREVRNVTSDLADLMQFHLDDMKKRGKRMSAEEAERRKRDLDELQVRFQITAERAAGNAPPVAAMPDEDGEEVEAGQEVRNPLSAATATGGGHSTSRQSASSPSSVPASGVGVVRRQAAMSAQEQARLVAVRTAKAEGDRILDSLGDSLQVVKGMACAIQDELTEQDRLLTDLSGRVEALQGRTEAANDTLDKALVAVSGKKCCSSGMCSYIVMAVVLLALLSAVYKMLN